MNLKITFITCLLLISSHSIFSQGRITLSSETTTKSLDFSNYSAIDVASDFHVNVNFSKSQEELSVTANANLMDRVHIYKENNTLYFRLKSNTNTRGKMILDVALTTASLNSYTGSSDAVITVNDLTKDQSVQVTLKSDAIFNGDITAEQLRIDLRSDAEMNGTVTVMDAEIEARSDAKVNINGSIERLHANLSSDSELKNRDLVIKDLRIKLSGDSNAWVRATNSLDATASGDSTLRFAGNPKIIKQRATGDADIISVN